MLNQLSRCNVNRASGGVYWILQNFGPSMVQQARSEVLSYTATVPHSKRMLDRFSGQQILYWDCGKISQTQRI